jgi:hypothetical protein
MPLLLRFDPGQALHVDREIPEGLLEQCIEIIPTSEVSDILLEKIGLPTNVVKIPCWEPGVLSSMMVDKASEVVRQDDRGTYSRDMPHWGLALQRTFYP